MTTIRAVTDVIAGGGESPVWDPEHERLHWVDNAAGTIHRCAPDGRDLQSWTLPGLVTAIALAGDEQLLVASGRRVLRFDVRSAELEELVRFDDPNPCNDGKVDRRGRFVVGTVEPAVFDPHRSDVEPTGRLYRIDHDLTVSVLAEAIGITNGPCSSVDGTTLYVGDSWSRTVYAFADDPATGSVADQQVFVRFEEGATPDGATVDAEGCLWVAEFRGGEVRRYSPDGELASRVAVPVTNPTSVMFGGPDLDVLFVTSHGGGARRLDGAVLAVAGLGVRGVPERRFGAVPANDPQAVPFES